MIPNSLMNAELSCGAMTYYVRPNVYHTAVPHTQLWPHATCLWTHNSINVGFGIVHETNSACKLSHALLSVVAAIEAVADAALAVFAAMVAALVASAIRDLLM